MNMKKKVLLITLILLMVSTAAFAQKKHKKAETEEVTFITNLDCVKCEKKCNSTLPYEKGVLDYKLDLEKKTIFFKFDPQKTSKEKLAKSIEKLGYTALETETVEKRK